MNENNNLELHEKLFGAQKPGKKKFPWFLVISVSLLLVAVILLSVFLSSYLSVVHLTSPDNGTTVVDNREDVRYVLAPMCYEPVAYMTDLYAKYGDMEYYAVADADPLEYICTIDMGIYDLYYSDKITLPILMDFEANYTRVCEVGNIAIMLHSIDKKGTEGIVNHFMSADTVDYSQVSGVETTLYLKLMSEKYNFMYYILTYYETKSGERYLYDRTMGRCVELGDLFKDEINGVK